MNTRRELDRIVVDWLADRTVDPPHGSLDEALGQVAVMPQERFGRLGAWRERLVRLLRGPDPFGDRRSRDRLALGAVVGGTAVAILVLAVTLVLPRDGGRPELGPATMSTHVVAVDGSGDFATIAEAVAAARDGDTVRVEPGTYTESVVIDKDIALTGQPADPSAVVVRIPRDGPLEATGWADLDPMRYAFLLRASDGSIEHLTIASEDRGTAAVIIDGGDPGIRGVQARLRDGASCDDRFVLIGAGAAGTIEGNESDACIDIYGAATPTVRGNVLAGPIAVGDHGTEARLIDNRVRWVLVDTGATAIIDDSDIGGFETGCAVNVHGPEASAATLRRNTIHDSRYGICVSAEASVTIEGNTLRDNELGMTVSSHGGEIRQNALAGNDVGIRLLGSDHLVEGNSVSGGRVGIMVSGGGAARLVDNSVEGATRGVAIDRFAEPTLEGNRLCGNDVDLWVAQGATPSIGENVICDRGGDRDPAAGATWIVSSAAGTADFDSIAEAVAAAADGDTVVVEPGTYEEALRIDKAITLQGGGDQPGDVVIAVPEDAPPPSEPIASLRWEFEAPMASLDPPTGIELSGARGSLRNLQVEGRMEGVAVLARRGVHALGDVVITFPGLAESCTCDHMAGALFVTDAAEVTVTDSELWYRAIVDGGSLLAIKDSDLWNARVGAQGASTLSLQNDRVHGDESASSIVILDGSDADIRSSTIDTFGIRVGSLNPDGTTAHIEGNTVRDVGDSAVWVSGGARATVIGNVISDSASGVNAANASVEVRDNDFIGNASGIVLNATDAIVSSNELRGGKVGITIFGGNRSDGGSKVTIEANTIEDMASRGISIGPGTTPIVTGNTICTGGQGIVVPPDADPIMRDNVICDERQPSE